MGEITKQELLHIGWVTSKAGGSKYKIVSNHNTYYMWEDELFITIGVSTMRTLAINSETIFRGKLECIDEMSTLMFQLGIK